jgi:hypothetical protein
MEDSRLYRRPVWGHVRKNLPASLRPSDEIFPKSLAFVRPIAILVKTMGTSSTIHLIHIHGLIGRLALLLRR